MPNSSTKVDLNPEVSKGTYDNKRERIRETQDRFIRCEDSYEDELKDISDAFRAYVEVDEWPADKKKKREGEGKPTTDVARFTNVVDVLSGNQIIRRSQGRAVAFEKDDLLTADFVNIYLQYRRQKQEIDHLDSDLFRNGALASRSHREFYLKPNSKDGSMEVYCEERPPDEIFIEKPFRKYDASDALNTFHAQWLSVDTVKAMYGLSDEEAKDLETRQFDEGITMTESTHAAGDEYSYPSDKQPDKFYDREIRQVRLIRRWKKWNKTIFRVVNLINPRSLAEANIGEFDNKQEAMEAAAQFLEQIGQQVTEDQLRDMIDRDTKEAYSYHVISGRVELEWIEEAGDFVPIRHFFGYWVNGKASGLWKRTRDEIISLNFLWNKLIERLGTVGWMPLLLEDDALSEGTQMETALQNWRDMKVVSLAPGAIAKNKVKVEQDHSLQAIGPYISIVEFLTNNLEQKVGANDAFQGIAPGANTAGIAIERLQQRGAAVVEPLMDNFKRFQRASDKMEIMMLNRAYKQRPLHTVVKIERIVGGMIDGTLDGGLKAFGQALNEGSTGDADISIQRILDALDAMDYDIRIDSQAASPSLRIAGLQAMAQLAPVVQVPVPPEIGIELFDFLPEQLKRKWMEALAARGLVLSELPMQQPQPQQGTNGVLNPNGQTL